MHVRCVKIGDFRDVIRGRRGLKARSKMCKYFEADGGGATLCISYNFDHLLIFTHTVNDSNSTVSYCIRLTLSVVVTPVNCNWFDETSRH